MRKLNRSHVTTPACLTNYRHGANTWDDVTPQHKSQIRACLEQMQDRRCAYCEGSLDELGQHIEHFRSRAAYPQHTFNWANLYWSCYQTDSCGCHKDASASPYNVNDLIDPCSDDPDEFFRFRTDGTIDIRAELNRSNQRKAQETLRVFNLNPQSGRLRQMRRNALSPYISIVTGCQGLSKQDLQNYLKDELLEAEELPFSTAIRHVLTEP